MISLKGWYKTVLKLVEDELLKTSELWDFMMIIWREEYMLEDWSEEVCKHHDYLKSKLSPPPHRDCFISEEQWKKAQEEK